ncbi:hypothetical protein [Deinococcus aquiradiocola]|uniref:TROVE domain-containing protein n=1 Tax=Deinococcus aquiradiocola TaxID=393059 RepID=A0A917UVA2_9DEIO|nr:hypothetical protein [Deinococcus aquiradiocola]GGJ87309.1 hypothetical protein GCM10008939_34200 [Deinococcus aquiradiocola]
MPSAETVAREDLILFLNAAFACTGQREFYHTADEQRVSVQFLHAYILGNYRRLYARTLAAGVNDFNAAEIIVNLLRSGQDTPVTFRTEENALLTAAIGRLPPQRGWKLITRLRQERINNRRTRALVRAYTLGQRDLTFQAVKYRRHVRAAALHAHLTLPGELPAFLFGKHQNVFRTPLLETFRQARYSHQAVYDLPFTVAQGMAAKHGIAPDLFLKNIAPRLTERERLRLQNRSGGKVEFRPERLPLTALCSYVLSLPMAERRERQDELTGWLDVAARRVLRRRPLPLPAGRTAAVLDNSFSASGSREKPRRPLALALATDWLLRSATAEGEYRAFWTHPVASPLLVRAEGQTNLTDRFLDALDWGAQTVIVVSDAVENDPPGVFHAAYTAARRLVLDLSVLHFNPVFDAEMLTVRALSPLLPAVGLRDADDLPTALGFARFAAGQTDVDELERYLSGRVQTFLNAGAVHVEA